MARDAALVTTWSFPVPGREAKSLEVFMEFLGFWAKRSAEGKCSPPETFFNVNGTNGMGIVKGKEDVLLQIADSDEYVKLIQKGQMIVRDLRTELHIGGTDEEVQRVTRLFAEAGAELGYM